MTTAKNMPSRFSAVQLIPLILALFVLFAFYVLPIVEQPELGSTTVNVLLAERGNNELDIPTNGLVIIPLATISLLVMGLWNVLNKDVSRAVAALTVLVGVLILVYYVIFGQEYAELEPDDIDYLSSMGVAFYAMLAGGIAMIAQIIIPRPKPLDPRFSLRRLAGNQESVIIVGIVLLIGIVGIASPRFVAERNVSDVIAGNAYIAIAAIGMTMVIITGNIDISVGSLVGVLASISGLLVTNGSPIWLAWLLPIFAGMLIEAGIGFLVAYMRIPSIVVTLGMLSILKGALIIGTGGDRIIGMPEEFFLAQMRPLGIPMPIYFMIILTILAQLWMRYSDMGRSFYAYGGNKEAARLSGISEKRVIMSAFILNGFFVGIASILYATQLNVIQATPPPALELTVITASVVGGVSILGGTGTVVGSTLATLLLNFIRSSLIFISISPFWLRAVQGVLILVTVLADLIRRRRQRF